MCRSYHPEEQGAKCTCILGMTVDVMRPEEFRGSERTVVNVVLDHQASHTHKYTHTNTHTHTHTQEG